MTSPEYGGPSEIMPVPVSCLAEEFENAIRRHGVVFCCEWFGYAPDSEFTAETIRILLARSAEKNGV